MISKDLAQRTTVASIVEIWNACERDLREAYALLAGIEDKLNTTLLQSRTLDLGNHRFRSIRDPERALESLALQVWGGIVDRLELRKLLSLAATKQLDDMLDESPRGFGRPERLGPITTENVSNILRGMLAAVPDQLEIAVREVYDLLRPHHSKLKTNSKFEIGSKVIIEGVINWRFYSSVKCGYCVDKLRALDRVFHMLDGKGLVPSTYYGELVDAIEASGKRVGDGAGETQFFRFKMFGNGNLHVWFKRADLLLRFNQLAGSGQLKPAV
jgi:hypothetical protein